MSNTIIRHKNKKKNYMIIMNEVFVRSDMSMSAKGVYAYLLTLPDDWVIIRNHLYKQFSDGKRSIDAAIKELEKKGYITKRRIKNEKSRFTGWDYKVFESLSDSPSAYEDAASSESPISESRNTDLSKFRTSKIDPLLNTDNILNIDNKNNIGILENAKHAFPSYTGEEVNKTNKKNTSRKDKNNLPSDGSVRNGYGKYTGNNKDKYETYTKRKNSVYKQSTQNNLTPNPVDIGESAGPPADGEKNSMQKNETSLYQKINQSFLSQNGNKFTNYGKEGKAIQQLIKKAQARSPDDPEGMIKSMISKFWELKNSRDKFWTKQPFLPSALNASGIWDRVLEEFRDNSHEMTEEELQRLLEEASL